MVYLYLKYEIMKAILTTKANKRKFKKKILLLFPSTDLQNRRNIVCILCVSLEKLICIIYVTIKLFHINAHYRRWSVLNMIHFWNLRYQNLKLTLHNKWITSWERIYLQSKVRAKFIWGELLTESTHRNQMISIVLKKNNNIFSTLDQKKSCWIIIQFFQHGVLAGSLVFCTPP